nr:tRNA (adenosine(37)-N6)-threonylcarbamoyltransferase complex ATPase subunit type 1 TsaE [candidate division Zixibacteria bacterium]
MIESRHNQILITGSAGETIAAGKGLAALLNNGDLISFTGPLGAGKTCFIRGIAIGLGINESDVKSPSYTLVNEYHGIIPLYHFDLYRMNKTDELYEIGWDDYLIREGVVVVEWGEKAGRNMPEERIQIFIEILDQTKRKIELEFLNL